MKKDKDEKKLKINWDSFQNEKHLFNIARKVLKFVSKYESIQISNLVSQNRADKLLKDKLNLAALNVFLATHVGKAEGTFLRAEGLRKVKAAEYFVKAKNEAEEKITDKLAENMAAAGIKKYRIREAKAKELISTLSNVMFRANKVVDSLDTAIHMLTAEWRRTQ